MGPQADIHFARLAESEFWPAVREWLELRIDLLDRVSTMRDGLAFEEFAVEAKARSGAAVLLRELVDQVEGARDSLAAQQPERPDGERLLVIEEE